VLPPSSGVAPTIDPDRGPPYDHGMRAVRFVVRTKLRALVVPTLLLTGVVGVVLAIVITLAAGAHRTETVPARVDAAAGGGFDYLITQQVNGQRPLTDAIRALPGVESADSYTFVFGGLVPAGASTNLSDGVDAYVFAGNEEAFGAHVVSGRSADPSVDDEFVVTKSFVDQTGAKLGDRFDLYTLTQESAANGFNPQHARRTLTATLVGIIDGAPMIEDPSADVIFPRRLIDRPEVGIGLTLTEVRVADGIDDSTLREQVATLPDSEQITVAPSPLVSADMQRAIRTQARGMWLLALVAGIAAIVTLTQVLIRQTRPSRAEREALTALGFSNGQVFMETMARAAPPIVAGGVLAAALAIPFSRVFPTGTVRHFEPSPGVLIQWGVLVSAMVVLIALLLALTGTVLALTRAQVGAVVPSPVVGAVASRSPVLPAAIGIRLGFTRARGERGSLRAALAGVLFTVGGLVGAITFGASLDRLIDQPFRYGWNMDVNVGDSGGERLDERLASALEADPNVESLIYYAEDYAKAGDTDVPMMGMKRVRGPAAPQLLSGRLPVSEDELAMGRVTARRVGVGVGDEVTLTGSAGSHSYHVVGLAVLTGLGSNEGVGEGALLTLDGLERISNAAVTSASVDFRSSPEEALAPYRELLGSSIEDGPYVPSPIVSLVRVQAVPYVLAGLLGVLVVLTITQTLLSSLRARRRDLAILRALGGAPRLLRRSVHWQATVVTLVPALIGVPVGLIAGRLVFKALADDIGAVDTADFPTWAVVAVVAAIVVLANVVAMWPARLAGRWSAAAALRAE
jgi:ABC-type lipoprotein release transport system permease subunit